MAYRHQNRSYLPQIGMLKEISDSDATLMVHRLKYGGPARHREYEARKALNDGSRWARNVLLKNKQVKAWDKHNEIGEMDTRCKPRLIRMPRSFKHAGSEFARVTKKGWAKLTRDSRSILKNASEAQKTDPDYVLRRIQDDGQALASAKDKFKGDPKYVKAAVESALKKRDSEEQDPWFLKKTAQAYSQLRI
jgi:hypothetical protein